MAEVACTKKQIQLDETHAKWRAAEAKLEEERRGDIASRARVTW